MEEDWRQKAERLKERMDFYGSHDVCMAFSGGVDSSLLLKLAVDAAGVHGRQVYALTFHTRLHPLCDLEIAERVAGELGGIHTVLYVDELEQEAIRQNPPDRCYLCKHHLFSRLKEFAREKGARFCMDGTNEDDLSQYRPGIRALRELGIVSPLAECQITKSEVKALAAEYGISVASRPSIPCMATRLPYGTEINYEVLERISKGEAFLREKAGGNIRLRLHQDVARIEADPEQLQRLVGDRDEIAAFLKSLGFVYVTLDLEGFRSGSMDVYIKEKQGN